MSQATSFPGQLRHETANGFAFVQLDMPGAARHAVLSLFNPGLFGFFITKQA